MGSCIPRVKLLYPELTQRDISVSAIFGYYSRSNNTTEELTEKAWSIDKETNDYVYKSFIEKWIIGFKHNSLSEHPSLHFYVEDISNIATKILEANSMGQNGVPVAYMEKSTRYVNMENAKVFDLIPQYFQTLAENGSNENINRFKEKFDKIIDKQISMYNDRLSLYERICESNGVPKSKAFDSAREYLPAGISTIVGVSLNIRSLKEVIVNLLSNGNCEAYMIGDQLLDICCNDFGEIIKRDEIIERVTYRANMLRGALHYSLDEMNSTARVMAGKMNPNYQFLKSIKTSEIFDYEKIRDNIKNEFYDEEGKFSLSKLTKCLANKDNSSRTVALNTFMGLECFLLERDGTLENCIDILNYIVELGHQGKMNVNDLPEATFDSYMTLLLKADYGSYRDIARHRRIKFVDRNFYSHNLVEKIYDCGDVNSNYNNFFTYYMDGIITSSPEDSESTAANKVALQIATYRYYIELTFDILDLIIDIKKLLEEVRYDAIESNLLLFELMSYLLPMSTEKMYKIKVSLPELIHLVQERIQPAGHLYYRSLASSIWQVMKNVFENEKFIHVIENGLSFEKEPNDGRGSIWKDVCLAIEDKIIQI